MTKAVKEGRISVEEGKDLLALSPEDRSHEGLFLSFQYPVEIPGVSMVTVSYTHLRYCARVA